MPRLPSIVFALAALAPSAAANAQVVEACTFDEPSATITVVPSAGLAHLEVVNGNEIWEGSAQCGTATTSNTDTIEIYPVLEDQVEISLEGGAFAPGLTDEGDGSSEIEFELAATDSSTYFGLAIIGSDGDDHIAVGHRPQSPVARNFTHDALLDLDADATIRDTDVAVILGFLEPLDLSLGSGADELSTTGVELGTFEPFLGRIAADMGPGQDRIEPVPLGQGSIEDPAYTGGPGKDLVSLAWLGDTCDAIWTTDWPDGHIEISGCADPLGGADGTVPIRQFERFIGHGAFDLFVGYDLPEEFHARGGDDVIWPFAGSDLIDGGGGTDRLALGWEDEDGLRVALDRGVVYDDGDFYRGVDHFTGIEEIVSESSGVDRFVGIPMPGLRRLTGSPEGDDILDLREAPGPVSLVAWDYTTFGHFAQDLWVHRLVVFGTPFDDVFMGMRGSSEANAFRGFEGDDVLLGVGGPDRLRGGSGNDRLDGGLGIDSCDGGSGVDVLIDCEKP